MRDSKKEDYTTMLLKLILILALGLAGVAMLETNTTPERTNGDPIPMCPPFCR